MIARRPNLFFLSLLFCGFSARADHDTLSLSSKKEASRSTLGLAADVSQFSFSGASIQGSGLKADFTHYLTDRIGAEVFLSTALTNSGSNSFNGFGTYAHYSFFSNCCGLTQKIKVGGQDLLEEQIPRSFKLQVGVGLNQYLFNGSSGVYSMSGPGAMIQAVDTFWGFTWFGGARTMILSNGHVNASGLSFYLGLSFSL